MLRLPRTGALRINSVYSIHIKMNSNRSRSNPPPVEPSQLPAAQRDTHEREYRQYQRDRSFMLNEMNTAKRNSQNEDERTALLRRLRALESENQQLNHDRSLTLQQLHEERLRNGYFLLVSFNLLANFPFNTTQV